MKPVKPYLSNDEFLTEVMAWANALLRLRIAQNRFPSFEQEPEDATPNAKTHERMYAAIQSRLAVSRANGFIPHLIHIAENAGLDATEIRLLCLTLLTSLATDIPAIARVVRNKRRIKASDVMDSLNTGVVLTMLCDDLTSRRNLRQYLRRQQNIFTKGVLILDDQAYVTEEEFLRVEVKLPRRVLNAILGETGLEEALFTYAKLVTPTVTLDNVIVHPELRKRVNAILEASRDEHHVHENWRKSLQLSFGRALTVLLVGPAGTGKTLLAHAVANALGKKLLHINFRQMAAESHNFHGDSPLAHVLREAWLQDAIPFFDECQDLFDRDRVGTDFLTSVEYQTGLILFATNEWVRLDKAFERRILYRLEVASPEANMREQIWNAHLPDASLLAPDLNVHELALTYELNGGNIKNAVLTAVQEAAARNPSAPLVTQNDFREAASLQLQQTIDLADLIVPKVDLQQVVLPHRLRAQVSELVEVARSSGGLFSDWGFDQTITRGKGLTVLFRGEPGTGKTHTAEAIAKELGRSLYKVNMAKVTSMYVGQTEKHLSSLFRSAAKTPSVLLFDEADGLFARRVENVASSNDRFVNNITNVLLQEFEEFNGLVILTTNLGANIDPAFDRRLAYRLDFPLPSAEARAAIWRALLPASCPVGPIDFVELGHQFALPGGNIKNAVLRAARLRYAQGKGALLQADLAEAAEIELASKAGVKKDIGFMGLGRGFELRTTDN